MKTAYFSMQDMQQVWENGGQDAYFATYGGTTAQPNPVNKVPLGRPMPPASGAAAPKAKATTQVLVRGKKGNFFRNQMTNVGAAVDGAARKGEAALVRGARAAGRGVKSAGSGVAAAGAAAGAVAGERMQALGSAIRRNPRTAGAIILGGTALGVGGGAYALDRDK